MADTRISKIKVRQGDFSDLPVLDPGEIGYAKDVGGYSSATIQ